MKNIRKWAIRITSGVLEWALLYLVLVKGITGAGNVLLFLIWLSMILAVLSYCYVKEAGGPGSKHPVSAMGQFRNYPTWWVWSTDFPMVLVMAWHGWWTTAIVLTLYLVIHTALVQEVNDAYARYEAA